MLSHSHSPTLLLTLSLTLHSLASWLPGPSLAASWLSGPLAPSFLLACTHCPTTPKRGVNVFSVCSRSKLSHATSSRHQHNMTSADTHVQLAGLSELHALLDAGRLPKDLVKQYVRLLRSIPPTLQYLFVQVSSRSLLSIPFNNCRLCLYLSSLCRTHILDRVEFVTSCL
jgi:hypothetical protein